ncbi:MAG TPA: NAD(P)-binding domain-containing protein [Acidobacteriota bacterium]|nr:NAD(P)-binding domain-containing protein [Acidobacteriota bacterium]
MKALFQPITAYTHWLHTSWPAGTVEKLPEAQEDGTTSIPGVRIVGDLTGIPLLKFSADTGARAVQEILNEPAFKSQKSSDSELIDIAIIGAGVSGISAAMEAKASNLSHKVFEASEIFSTVVNFPKAKPIYTYPTDMTPTGHLQFKATVKESLLEEMESQRRKSGIDVTFARIERIERKGSELLLHHGDGKTVTRAKRVIIAIGRSGNHRKLNVPGENLDKVFNRLYDPKEFHGKNVLVVGGGDSALETAIALTLSGADVTLSYRKKEFARPKPENIEKIEMLQKNPGADISLEKPTSERVTTSITSGMRSKGEQGSLHLALSTRVKEIHNDRVILIDEQNQESVLKNDVVFTMIGREAPLDFFRRSGISIRGEWKAATWIGFIAFLLFCVFLYNWKAGGSLNKAFQANNWFPYNIPIIFSEAAANPSSLLGTLVRSMREPSFYYSLAYCLAVVIFGIRRIKRRKTPYVKAQTIALMAIQVIPLFILPQLLLPWMGYNGWFDHAAGKGFADALFPVVKYGHGREYWRASGLILAWPLFIWNVFTGQPLWWWLGISFLQTFVIIPLIIFRWGKGAYCGWICSCGALAETLGDSHRQKMPHGPFWNRVNMVGQVVLLAAIVLLIARILSWTLPQSELGILSRKLYSGLLSTWTLFGIKLNYYYVVDIFLAGIIGVGMYFWFSGRVWCRFACPLAALMHIYTRFSRFRIFAEKSKCISCNVCTSVCHQGIDIMNFANKGLPMNDPQCVRCSACVQQCPTGTLSFGRFDKNQQPILDIIPASMVRLKEK